jgi:precorrin-6y C5,15-methyltransferase (decarboxylating) CbiE subunit
MADQLVIVGTGPGNIEMLTPEALNAIRRSEIIIGSNRLLDIFAQPGQLCYELSGDLNSIRPNLTVWGKRKSVILVSGDPGFYSILDWLKREFPTINYQVIPGISSIQLAFARIAQSWYDCKIISLHGRPFQDIVGAVKCNRKVCILTDGKNSPAYIVRQLSVAGLFEKWLFIGSALGTAREQGWRAIPGPRPLQARE